MIFSGLNQNSTLNLQWNCYLESFPDYGDKTIAVLAQPSCVYDSMALHLLSECINTLPVGVEASMNPMGEWFAEVVSDIANFVSPALAFIPEVGPALAAGAGALGKGANMYLDYSKKQGYTGPDRTYSTPPKAMAAPQLGLQQKRRRAKNKNKKNKGTIGPKLPSVPAGYKIVKG